MGKRALRFCYILITPGSTELGPILFAHAVRAWANVVITQGIAQGVYNIGPGSDRVRKQYWAKIVHNFATRVSALREGVGLSASFKFSHRSSEKFCVTVELLFVHICSCDETSVSAYFQMKFFSPPHLERYNRATDCFEEITRIFLHARARAKCSIIYLTQRNR